MSNCVRVLLVLQVVFDVELLIIFFQLRIKKNKQLEDFPPHVGVVSLVLGAMRGVVHWQD